MGRAVLIVDDSRITRRLVRSALEKQSLFEHYIEAADGFQALAAVARQPIDLILTDLEMPRLDGLAFLRAFRADARNARIPVLMLSSVEETGLKVEGLRRGGNDYILKTCDPAELCARVENYLRLKLLQDELEAKNIELSKKNEELAAIASTDALTGLHNRRHFFLRADEELARARRYGHEFGLVMLDADHFKRINDTMGHKQGDIVLVAIARVMRATLRETDLVGRLGGEEFAVCLPETSASSALVVAERLRVAIQRCPIPGMDRSVTVSLGVSAFPTGDDDSIDLLLQLADEALYAAKAHGRNRVESALAAPWVGDDAAVGAMV